MNRATIVLASAADRQQARACIAQAPMGYVVTVQPPRRTAAQNAAMWPILEAFAGQLQWPVDGELVYMTPEEWKDVLTAAFRDETDRIAQGLRGGYVMLGASTSEMVEPEFSEFLEFLRSTAVDRGVDIGEGDL